MFFYLLLLLIYLVVILGMNFGFYVWEVSVFLGSCFSFEKVVWVFLVLDFLKIRVESKQINNLNFILSDILEYVKF